MIFQLKLFKVLYLGKRVETHFYNIGRAYGPIKAAIWRDMAYVHFVATGINPLVLAR